MQGKSQEIWEASARPSSSATCFKMSCLCPLKAFLIVNSYLPNRKKLLEYKPSTYAVMQNRRSIKLPPTFFCQSLKKISGP